MGDSTIRSRFRRQIILLAPAAFTASLFRAKDVRAQNQGQNPSGQNNSRPATTQPPPMHLQNGDAPDPTDLRPPYEKRLTGDNADARLPNGKLQTDEILKDDYAKNLKDARDLTGLARGLEEDLEKNEAFVFSLASLKKLDDMERLTKRIRARMKRY
jgi:hypothetical protein